MTMETPEMKCTISEICAGSEKMMEMPDAEWPASGGREPICADDLKDAWMLMYRQKINFNENVPD